MDATCRKRKYRSRTEEIVKKVLFPASPLRNISNNQYFDRSTVNVPETDPVPVTPVKVILEDTYSINLLSSYTELTPMKIQCKSDVHTNIEKGDLPCPSYTELPPITINSKSDVNINIEVGGMQQKEVSELVSEVATFNQISEYPNPQQEPHSSSEAQSTSEGIQQPLLQLPPTKVQKPTEIVSTPAQASRKSKRKYLEKTSISSSEKTTFDQKAPPVLDCSKIKKGISRKNIKPTQKIDCKKIKPKKQNEIKFEWNDVEFFHEVNVNSVNGFSLPTSVKSPLDYFERFFDDYTINLIVEGTNLYSTTHRGNSLATNSDEIKDFLAIELLMGIIKLPAYTDYWCSDLRINIIADVMPIKRYKLIRRYIHFNDNDDDTGTDRYFKMRPFIDHLRRKFNEIENERIQSIDEMMIPYKGTKAGSRKQYVKNKPKKWGYKNFVRSGSSGIVYDFVLYAGENTFWQYTFTEYEEALGFGAKVVLALCKTLPDPPLTKVYFDNFFASLELMHYLREEFGILSLGTMRANRLRNCPLASDKILKKKGRGSFQQKADNKQKICVVKWQDNRSVILASSFVSAYPILSAKRYCKDSKTKVEVACPNIVKQYNAHMGGVDLSDMFISLYRTGFKTQRWYLAIFSQLIDIAVNNAWLLCRRDQNLLQIPEINESIIEDGLNEESTKYLALKKFRKLIAQSLLKKNKIAGRPTAQNRPKKVIKKPKIRPLQEVRYDQIGHNLNFSTKGRCKLCTTGQTTAKCVKCDVRLCALEKRNCFFTFHNK